MASTVGLPCESAASESRWRVELSLGAAHNLDSTLRVEQAGQPTLDVDARWDGRSFEPPLYYGWRLARGAWALRFVHLKAYLANPTHDVSRFSVSHGYNLLTLERAFGVHGFDLWAGAGLVIAHPESTVRGLTRPEDSGGALGGGYFVTGPTGALAVSRRVRLGGRLALVPEVRFTLSRARVPVAEGDASVPNTAVHALLGVEFRF